jgi:hypothetical protein
MSCIPHFGEASFWSRSTSSHSAQGLAGRFFIQAALLPNLTFMPVRIKIMQSSVQHYVLSPYQTANYIVRESAVSNFLRFERSETIVNACLRLL